MDQYFHPCPECKIEARKKNVAPKKPETWLEQPKFYSRAIWWAGCRAHGHLAGGVTEGVAVHNWNREAYRIERETAIRG